LHHLGCVFDGKGEDGEGLGGRCVKRRGRKQKGRSDGDRCLCIASDDVSKKCVESRWGEGRNGGALVQKGPRLCAQSFRLSVRAAKG
jgi:hypothetical protein